MNDDDEARRAFAAIGRTLDALREEFPDDPSIVTHILGSAMLVEITAVTADDAAATRSKAIGYFLCDCETPKEALALLRDAFRLFVDHSPETKRSAFKVIPGGKL